MKRLDVKIHIRLVRHLQRICGALCLGKSVPGITARYGALALLVLMHSITATSADVPRELGIKIHVEALTATPASVGGKSLIQFRIVNASETKFVLLSISTPVARRAKLLATVAAEKTAVLESISIPPSEILDLTTFHLKYEISPLKRSLVTGDEFPITLNFVVGSITVSVHVH